MTLVARQCPSPRCGDPAAGMQAARNIFADLPCLAKNVWIFPWEKPVSPAISRCHSTMASDDPFRPYKQTSYYAAANFATRANASR